MKPIEFSITRPVMACRGVAVLAVVFLALAFLLKPSLTFAAAATNPTTKPATTQPTSAVAPAAAPATQPADTAQAPSDQEVRQIRILQLPPSLTNFKFSSFFVQWIVSEEDWKAFWKSSLQSALQQDAPTLPVDWNTESLLAIFWPAKKDIHLPAFIGTEEIQGSGTLGLRLKFGLNLPCPKKSLDEPGAAPVATKSSSAATDTRSPAAFLVMDQSVLNDIDSVTVRTEHTRSLGCY